MTGERRISSTYLPFRKRPQSDVGMAIRAPETGHSLSAMFPVSPPPTGHFGKSNREQILGNGVPLDALAVIAPATVPLWVPNRERQDCQNAVH